MADISDSDGETKSMEERKRPGPRLRRPRLRASANCFAVPLQPGRCFRMLLTARLVISALMMTPQLAPFAAREPGGPGRTAGRAPLGAL